MNRRLYPLNTPSSGTGWIGFIFAAIVIVAIVYPLMYRASATTVEFIVDDKERVCDSSSENGQTCRYLVFTPDEVFENTDSLLFGKFNSSDVYGQLQIGQGYRAKVAGWRIPFLSAYRNIIETEPLG